MLRSLLRRIPLRSARPATSEEEQADKTVSNDTDQQNDATEETRRVDYEVLVILHDVLERAPR